MLANRAVSIVIGAAVLIPAACTSSSQGCSGDNCPAKLIKVTGVLREIGGPPPGIDKPLAGEIVVHKGASSTGPEVGRVSADSTGRFVVRVPPGTYFFVGTPRHVGITCSSVHKVVAKTRTPSFDLVCMIP
jgi:hypothetical protein